MPIKHHCLCFYSNSFYLHFSWSLIFHITVNIIIYSAFDKKVEKYKIQRLRDVSGNTVVISGKQINLILWDETILQELYLFEFTSTDMSIYLFIISL